VNDYLVQEVAWPVTNPGERDTAPNWLFLTSQISH